MTKEVEVRYNLMECVYESIRNNLTEDEMFSLVFTECNFDETTATDFMTAVVMAKIHYKCITFE